MTINFNGTNGITFPDASVQNTAATGFGFKNRLINGSFEIAQRASSATVTAGTGVPTASTGYPCVDRWFVYSTGANVTAAYVTGVSPNPHMLQITGATSVTAVGIGQRIEANNSADLAGNVCTLSVDIANSQLTTVTWTASYANTADTFGTIGTPTKTQIATGTFTVTSTMTRYSTNITIPSAATTGIEILFTVGAQTAGTWQLDNAQLEKSPTATTFDYRPYGTELALCQRYTWVVNSAAASGATIALGLAYNGAANSCPLQYPVPMRASPTITFSAGTDFTATNGGGVNIASTSMSVFGTNSSAVEIQTSVASGYTVGQASILRSANVNARIYIAAEL